jgi:hypothetical protein
VQETVRRVKPGGVSVETQMSSVDVDLSYKKKSEKEKFSYAK